MSLLNDRLIRARYELAALRWLLKLPPSPPPPPPPRPSTDIPQTHETHGD